MIDEPVITKAKSWSELQIEQRKTEPVALPRIMHLDLPPYELTFWDKVKLIPTLFIILKGHLMGDLKTTISGVVKLGFQMATLFGIGTGHLTEAIVTSILWGIASIYQSYQQADKK